MKKIIALVLALVMVLSLSTVAFAKKCDETPALADIAAGMLYVPAQNLAKFVVQNHEKITEDLNAVSAYANNVVRQVKTAVDNTVIMANGLVYTVAASYQLGGSMILAAAKLIDEDYTEKLTDDETIVGWIARCIANSEDYEAGFVGKIAEVKEEIDDVLTAVLDYTANPTAVKKYSSYKGSFAAAAFNEFVDEVIPEMQDAENFLPGEAVAEGLVRIASFIFNGGHKK